MIVFFPLLLDLFKVCREANCGMTCDQDNIRFHFSGAMVTVSGTCNGGHDFRWQSSPSVGSGKKKVAAINALIGTYGYLCGINVKKVLTCNNVKSVTQDIIFQLLEFFGCLRLVCVSRAFMFQIQTRVLYNVIWSYWQFMQVSWTNSILTMCTLKFLSYPFGYRLSIHIIGIFSAAIWGNIYRCDNLWHLRMAFKYLFMLNCPI